MWADEDEEEGVRSAWDWCGDVMKWIIIIFTIWLLVFLIAYCSERSAQQTEELQLTPSQLAACRLHAISSTDCP